MINADIFGQEITPIDRNIYLFAVDDEYGETFMFIPLVMKNMELNELSVMNS